MLWWRGRSDIMQSIGVLCGIVTVLLGPVRIQKYDKCEAEKREEISEKFLEELTQRCDTLISLLSFFYRCTLWRIGYCEYLSFRRNFVHK